MTPTTSETSNPRKRGRRAWLWRTGERGQAIVLFVAFFTVVSVAGALAVDAGLWFTERRGLQKVADGAALGGAQEYLTDLLAQGGEGNCEPFPSGPPTTPDAYQAACYWAALNGADDGSTTVQVTTGTDGCRTPGDGMPWVEVVAKRESPLFFSKLAGFLANHAVLPFDIAAVARACAGSTAIAEGTLPFEVDIQTSPCFAADGSPVFGSLCGIEFDAKNPQQGGGPGQSARGLLDLYVDKPAPNDFCSDTNGGVSTGPGSTEDLILNGARGACIIAAPVSAASCKMGAADPWYDCVAVQTTNTKAVLDGTYSRLSRENHLPPVSPCYSTSGASFVQITEPDPRNPDMFRPVDCDPDEDGTQPSPRLGTLIVLPEHPDPPGQNERSKGFPIFGLAGFYIEGCAVDDGPIDPYCSQGQPRGNSQGKGPKDQDPPGKVVVYGRLANITYSGGAIGAITTATTVLGVALVK